MENENKQNKKRKSFGKEILTGGILTEEGVVKQSKLLVLIVLLIVIFISNGYSCMKKLTKIEELKVRLQDVKSENLILSTQLTSSSRQSQVEALLKEKGIALSRSTGPVFEIKK